MKVKMRKLALGGSELSLNFDSIAPIFDDPTHHDLAFALYNRTTVG